jgi:hypothetical protein
MNFVLSRVHAHTHTHMQRYKGLVLGGEGMVGLSGTRHHKHTGPANRSDVVHLPTVSTLFNSKKIHSNLNNLNTFTKETSSTNVK